MARPKFNVLHFLVCPLVTVDRAVPENPYTLHDVNYSYLVGEEREFPVVEPELWIYGRLLGSRGRLELNLRVVWLDSPQEPTEIGVYVLPPLRFARIGEVICRAWKLAVVPFPGLGRYAFELRRGNRNRVFAEDVIEVRK